MKLERVTNNSFWTGLAIAFARSFPAWLGEPIAKLIGTIGAMNPNSPVVQALRLNQWVIHDGKISPEDLQQVVKKTYQHQAKAIFETFHYMNRRDRMKDLVSFNPKFQKLIDEQAHSSRGLIMLLPHMCGFDLCGFALGNYGFKFLTLSYPNPPSGYEWQNKIREDHGMDVMPFSPSALRAARERLQAGGAVLTGLDRPNPESGYLPKFFGRPAALPVSYVRLALKTNARVHVVGVESTDGKYVVDVSDEIPMIPNEDGHLEVIQNAESVMKAAETYIRRNITSWAMFYPVWPEARDEVPVS